jgi:hypothetical protein
MIGVGVIDIHKNQHWSLPISRYGVCTGFLATLECDAKARRKVIGEHWKTGGPLAALPLLLSNACVGLVGLGGGV